MVETGSIISKPSDRVQTNSDGGVLYNKLTDHIKRLVADGKLEDLGDTCRTLVKIPFNSVSGAAAFITGRSINGWDFFSDINELRNDSI